MAANPRHSHETDDTLVLFSTSLCGKQSRPCNRLHSVSSRRKLCRYLVPGTFVCRIQPTRPLLIVPPRRFVTAPFFNCFWSWILSGTASTFLVSYFEALGHPFIRRPTSYVRAGLLVFVLLQPCLKFHVLLLAFGHVLLAFGHVFAGFWPRVCRLLAMVFVPLARLGNELMQQYEQCPCSEGCVLHSPTFRGRTIWMMKLEYIGKYAWFRVFWM